MSFAGNVARMGQGRIAYRFLIGKPEGLWRLRYRWEDNITMDVRGI
jgi:hypothetical protein